MRFLYTEEMIEWLKDNVKGVHYDVLTIRFNEHFGTDKNICSINQACKNRGINNGFDGRYKKGNKAYFKNKKLSFEHKKKIAYTWFKNGIAGHNRAEILSERRHNGRPVIKVGEYKWEPKKDYIYKKFFGEKPEDTSVIQIDGNVDNFDLDNLMLLTRSESYALSKMNLRSRDKDVVLTAINLIRLKRRIRELKKCSQR